MPVTDATIIRRSLTGRLFSTVTTALTVAVAVALLLTLLTLRDAGEQAFLRGGGNMHLVVSRDASELESVLNSVFYAGAPSAAITWDQYEDFLNRPPAAGAGGGGRTPPVIVQLDWAIPVQLGDSFRGLPVLATSLDFFEKFQPEVDRPFRVADGRVFERSFEVVAGAEAARLSGVRVGQTIFLTHGMPRDPQAHVHNEYAYTVVGILERAGTPQDRLFFTDLESSWILHAHDRRAIEPGFDPGSRLTSADLIPADRLITGIYLRARTRAGSQTSATLPRLFEQIRRDGRFTVASPSDQTNRLMSIVGNVNEIFLAMALVVLVSSGIAIMLALYNSMEQRRRQVAVLRVLGASRGRIFGLVLTESAVLGLIGALCGVLLALGGTRIVAGVMEARLGLRIEPMIGLEWTLAAVVGATLLASAAGVVPAVMAYRTSVIRSLRPLG